MRQLCLFFVTYVCLRLSWSERTQRSYNNRILAELGIRTTAVTAPGEEAYSRRLLLATYAHQVMYAAGLGCAGKGTGNFLCGRSLMGDTTSCDYIGYTSPEGQRLLAAYLQRATPEKHTGEYSPHISENKVECLANSTRQTVRVDADIVIPPGGEVMLTSAHGVAASECGCALWSSRLWICQGIKMQKR